MRRIHPQAVADLHIALVKPTDERVVHAHGAPRRSPRSPTSFHRRAAHAARSAPRPTTARVPVELHLVDSAAREIFGALAADVAAPRPPPRRRTRPRSTHGSRAWGAGSVCWRGCRPRGWAPRRSAACTPSCGRCARSSPGRSACRRAIEAWTGPEPALHDFQHARAAIEVKSTAGAQHQVLRISSERQLDDTGTSALYLVHVSIDARQGGTRDAARRSSRSSATRRAAPPRRRRSRIASGRPATSTSTPAATRRDTRCGASAPTASQQGFPRIVEADLLDGVGDVRYSVAVTECRDWERPLGELTARLRGRPDG